MSSLNRIFVFFEEFLSCRFPYGTYWQVIVDQVIPFPPPELTKLKYRFLKIPDDLTVYASLSIYSPRILYHKKILDLVQQSRKILAKAVAQQFFGCFMNPIDFSEIWLIRSISRFFLFFQ
jgi:transcription initiation factor TFIID subunit 2